MCIRDSQETVYSFRQLHAEVQRMAATLQSLGVKKGDRVLVYMPMIPEAAFAMLACARIGAIHSVVFGGFASVSLASRIDDAEPTVIVSADAGSRGGKVVAYKPLLDEAIKLAVNKPAKVLMIDRGLSPFERVAGRDTQVRDRCQTVRPTGLLPTAQSAPWAKPSSPWPIFATPPKCPSYRPTPRPPTACWPTAWAGRCATCASR